MDPSITSLESQISGLGMFVGNFTHNLDPKRRLTIPSVWRAQIGKPEAVYVSPDFHQKCLTVYPTSELVRKLEALRRCSMGDAAARQQARALGGNSELLAWDVQGRIRIKDDLLTFAGLTDAVILVGAMDRIELWSPEHSVEGAQLGAEKLQKLGPSNVHF
ncbi:MAG: division/cell wall cluster transcriptional repressor MraZ [Verrucomicrobia bacterium]|nr:division/cell wall cluster transcriptional repressor MraZ [Verrucomicrobiota bacterium]